MMGSKNRHFAPLIQISLEELVPQDHFYRYLERTLDLSFVDVERFALVRSYQCSRLREARRIPYDSSRGKAGQTSSF